MNASRRTLFSGRGRWGLIILLIGAAMAVAVSALPFWWRDTIVAQSAEARNELRLLEARINGANPASRPAIAAGDDVRLLFVDGATTGLAMATLQRLTAKVAEETGMVLQRTQPLQAEDRDGMTVLRMETEATGNLESLRSYLVALETREPLIFINRAKIGVGKSGEDTGGSLPSETLVVALQLEAYSTPEAAP